MAKKEFVHRILIVSAEEADVALLRESLADLADEVRCAADISAALTALRGSMPTLILVDAEMSGAGDSPAFYDILAAANQAATPILLLVSMHDNALKIEGLRAGVTDIVSKPINTESARARVSSLIRLRATHEKHLASQKNIQAAAADATVRVFARGVAHNFNNMLTAGMGFLSLAMDEVTDPDTLTALRNVELTHRRMAYLARQLLNFTGDAELNLRTTEVSHILHDALRLFDATALKSGVTMLCDFTALRGVFVEVDEFHLAQALLQILNNAREAIDVSKGRIRFYGSIEHDEVVISIQDTGPGMQPEVVRAICDPFYTTKQVVGVGLGLSSTQSLLAGFGARMEIDSKPDAGTTVRIMMPRHEPEDVIEAHADSVARFRRGLSILLAVDAQETREALHAVLLAGAFLVDTAQTEDDLVDSLQKSTNHYDLIVIDLLRSELVGDDIIDALRQLTDLPVIFLYSTRNEAPLVTDSVALLRKPFDAEKLFDALRRFPSLLIPEDL